MRRLKAAIPGRVPSKGMCQAEKLRSVLQHCHQGPAGTGLGGTLRTDCFWGGAGGHPSSPGLDSCHTVGSIEKRPWSM